MHRRRSCLTQRRYRKKIEDKATFLSNEVARLRDEFQELKVRKTRVLKPAVPRTNPLRLVVEYFHRFRHGLDLQQPLDEEHAQKNFLQRVMASEVASNRGFGVQTMLDEWRTLPLRHDNLEVALVKLNYGAKYVIVADVKIATTITEPALHKALAGMNADDKETNLPMLAWKLLVQRLVLPGTVRFEWDEANYQFSSVFSQVDMLRPLMRLLGTVAETSIVLNCALGIAV
ncbi:hypothetical protein PHYSODRAFT_526585 [Phytophthora sojae]|uniref:BZIP domain-containing protein n=1 Tax=Phytophthora sojae (strain P6497) TaxID=1094619 RepID=G5A7V4_PHYSP|nr:hypothetical protein PHYSODRAFT_526585 [Phytophthora sojae]EGZ07980.1 hypothetical protein PHYSODRAFT_526585 [Phytophthora sojae]|eukprot:XP_009536152.1 hypothetical protein PHYSODRAFT_526585 [Phytophthora sojae]